MLQFDFDESLSLGDWVERMLRSVFGLVEVSVLNEDDGERFGEGGRVDVVFGRGVVDVGGKSEVGDYVVARGFEIGERELSLSVERSEMVKRFGERIVLSCIGMWFERVRGMGERWMSDGGEGGEWDDGSLRWLEDVMGSYEFAWSELYRGEKLKRDDEREVL